MVVFPTVQNPGTCEGLCLSTCYYCSLFPNIQHVASSVFNFRVLSLAKTCLRLHTCVFCANKMKIQDYFNAATLRRQV